MASSSDTYPEREDPVEELLANCLDRDPDDWAAAVEAACAKHPGAASELRARFAMLNGLTLEPDTEKIPERLGEFEIEAQLGAGGMGVVYRAKQPSLNRHVAVKLVRPEFQFFANAKQRFAREVAAVASLRHESVVSIHSVGETGGLPFYAMELLPGKSLAQALDGLRGRAPESLTGHDLYLQVADGSHADALPELFAGTWVDACLRITNQVADALTHAHARGILHRDIKPSNIMLTPEGRAVVLDFGLSGLVEAAGEHRLTRSGSHLGTAAYMAPEQILGASRVGAAADIYALGVTLYELLTLRTPFEGDGVAAMQQAILSGRAHPVRATNRAVSEEAQVVCHLAMARFVGDRYASAQAFADDLGNILARRPIQAQPPSNLRRAYRWVQRRPAQATALALALVLSTGVPTLLWMTSRAHAKELATALDAERAAKGELRDVVEFLVQVFRQAVPGVSGAAPELSAKDLVRRGAAQVGDMLSGRPSSRARVDLILATIYGGLGMYGPSTNRAAAAEAFYKDRDTAEHIRFLAESQRIQAASLGSMQQRKAAIRLSAAALATAQRVYSDGDPRLRKFVNDRIQLLGMDGDFAAASALANRQLGISRGVALSALGWAMNVQSKYAEAAPVLSAAVAILVDGDRLLDPMGARALLNLAHAHRSRRDMKRAALTLEHAIRVMRAAPRFGKDHYRVDVARGELLEARLQLGQLEKKAIQKFADIADRLEQGLSPTNTYTVQARINQMKALVHFGEWANALAVCDDFALVAAAERALATHNRTTVANIHTRRARALMGLKRVSEAQTALRAAADIHRAQVKLRGPRPLVQTLFNLATIAQRVGELSEAAAAAEEIVSATESQIVLLEPRGGGTSADAGVLGLKLLGQLATRAGDGQEIARITKLLKARMQKVAAAKQDN